MEGKKSNKICHTVKDKTTLDALTDSLSGEKLQTEQISMHMQYHQKGEAEKTQGHIFSNQHVPNMIFWYQNVSEDSLYIDFRKKHKNHMWYSKRKYYIVSLELGASIQVIVTVQVAKTYFRRHSNIKVFGCIKTIYKENLLRIKATELSHDISLTEREL